MGCAVRSAESKKLTLVEHLGELKGRILKSVLFIIIASCASYSFADVIIRHLVRPVGKVVFIAPQEAFLANIKLAFFGGLIISSPFVLYHIWRFVNSGLEAGERRYILIFAPLSFVLFIMGAAFGYLIIIPIGIKFLLGFGSDILTPMISVSGYISFVGFLTLAFGAIFELPVATLFLTKIGLVTPAFLAKKRRYVLILVFIIAAAITPPDVVTQILMAVPLLILYETSIILSKLVYK